MKEKVWEKRYRKLLKDAQEKITILTKMGMDMSLEIVQYRKRIKELEEVLEEKGAGE